MFSTLFLLLIFISIIFRIKYKYDKIKNEINYLKDKILMNTNIWEKLSLTTFFVKLDKSHYYKGNIVNRFDFHDCLSKEIITSIFCHEDININNWIFDGITGSIFIFDGRYIYCSNLSESREWKIVFDSTFSNTSLGILTIYKRYLILITKNIYVWNLSKPFNPNINYYNIKYRPPDFQHSFNRNDFNKSSKVSSFPCRNVFIIQYCNRNKYYIDDLVIIILKFSNGFEVIINEYENVNSPMLLNKNAQLYFITFIFSGLGESGVENGYAITLFNTVEDIVNNNEIEIIVNIFEKDYHKKYAEYDVKNNTIYYLNSNISDISTSEFQDPKLDYHFSVKYKNVQIIKETRYITRSRGNFVLKVDKSIYIEFDRYTPKFLYPSITGWRNMKYNDMTTIGKLYKILIRFILNGKSVELSDIIFDYMFIC
jgi:hypothetical protein